MSWKPIDFQGIMTLSPVTIDQLNRYLQDKETYVANYIIHTLQPYPAISAAFPHLQPSLETPGTLAEAVKIFSSQMQQITGHPEYPIDYNDWKEVVKKINKESWNYLELIEESIIELLQLIEHMPIEEWNQETTQHVVQVTVMLNQKMADFHGALLLLEKELYRYRWFSEELASKWGKVKHYLLFWSPLLDRTLFSNAIKSQKYLKFTQKKIVDGYSGYHELDDKITRSMEKFNRYHVLQKLDSDLQSQFKKFYQLTRLWYLNGNAKAFPQSNLVRAFRSQIDPAKILALARAYYQALNSVLFMLARSVKQYPPHSFSFDANLQMQGHVKICHEELHVLGSTMAQYREFLLRSDPNPYVANRLGFPEWIVGPEPTQTKQILAMQRDLSSLDALFISFLQGLERKLSTDDIPLSKVQESVQNILHEMAQPLISRSSMRLHADRLIYEIMQLDELTHSDPKCVPYIGFVLSRALRADWKYHVLFDIPQFHHMYSIHISLVGALDDREHLNRTIKFKRLLQQLTQWVKHHDTPKHPHEIESDVHDIKSYLQKFLAHTERLTSSGSQELSEQLRVPLAEIEQQLLEYRYMFGRFFHILHAGKPEERMIRKQFLFVDQYFEAIENRLIQALTQSAG